MIVNPSPFNPPQVQCLTHAWTSTPSYAEFYDTFTGGCPRHESSRTHPNSARHSILTEPRRAHARVHLQTTQRWAIEIVTKCEHCEDFRCRSSKSPEEPCARDVLGYLICRYRMASMWRPSRRTLGRVVDRLASDAKPVWATQPLVPVIFDSSPQCQSGPTGHQREHPVEDVGRGSYCVAESAGAARETMDD